MVADEDSSETSLKAKREFFSWKRVPKVSKKNSENAAPPETTLKTMSMIVDHSRPRTNLADGIVPMIPTDFWSKPQTKKTFSTETNDIKVTKLALNNPLVPLGMAATTGCLIGMIYTTIKRDRLKTQYFMRGRIAAQFFTFCVLVGGAWYLGSKDYKPSTDPIIKSFNGNMEGTTSS